MISIEQIVGLIGQRVTISLTNGRKVKNAVLIGVRPVTFGFEAPEEDNYRVTLAAFHRECGCEYSATDTECYTVWSERRNPVNAVRGRYGLPIFGWPDSDATRARPVCLEDVDLTLHLSEIKEVK